MADEAPELHRVNWREVFGFTQIFGSFRLSRHVTKLAIALAAVLLTWGTGKVMDLIFTPLADNYAAPVNLDDGTAAMEPDAYWRGGDFKKFRKDAAKACEDGLAKLATEQIADKPLYNSLDDATAAVKKSPGKVRGDLLDALEARLKKAADAANTARDDSLNANKDIKDSDKRSEADDKAEEARMDKIRAANAQYVAGERKVCLLKPQPVYATFADYEGHYFHQAITAILHRDIFTGFTTLDTERRAPQARMSRQLTAEGRQAAGGADPLGLLAALYLMACGVAWLVCTHWIFAVIFLLALLVIWSVAGGVIARAAALQATRDEKAGVGECLKFALKKFRSFLASPLVPIAVFLVVGVLTAIVVAALGGIPGFGGIWIGIFFGLALIAGVLLAFLVIGLLAGGLLMAPTIAVEGSDTFDACTRSYQFVLARPWRATLYGLVAAGYGTLCCLFVRFLLFLVLRSAHWIVSLGTFYTDGGSVREGATKWDLMWPAPTFDRFHSGVAPLGLKDGLNAVDWFGGWMVWCWVGLVSAILLAWVMSYLLSAGTYIYLLLRKAEDATDLDEVYVEEPAEEPAPTEPVAPAAPAAAPPAATTPPGPAATEPPPAGEPPKAP